MLEEIRIKGLGVIDDAVLSFDPGLTVVTGETGAGKTMVVTGLGLLFGGRAETSRLRPGVESASVEGRVVLAAGSAGGRHRHRRRRGRRRRLQPGAAPGGQRRRPVPGRRRRRRPSRPRC